ncbi:MAG: PadR family transcriptional regulator [Candidatus Bathyarchaeia archaeon]
MAVERLRSKLTKENLWIYILSMLRKGPMYGYEIASKLRGELNINASIITTYVVLYKMEKEKLIQRERSKGKTSRKVYYSITERGVLSLEKGLETLDDTLRTLREI